MRISLAPQEEFPSTFSYRTVPKEAIRSPMGRKPDLLSNPILLPHEPARVPGRAVSISGRAEEEGR